MRRLKELSLRLPRLTVQGFKDGLSGAAFFRGWFRSGVQGIRVYWFGIGNLGMRLEVRAYGSGVG